MSDLPLFATPPEVAELLRVKAARVRRWIERGELHASNLGDKGRPRYRIARMDLIAFLNDRSGAKVSPPKAKPRRKAKPDLPGRY